MEGDMLIGGGKNVYYASGSTIAAFPTGNSSHLFFADLKDQSKYNVQTSRLAALSHGIMHRCGGSYWG